MTTLKSPQQTGSRQFRQQSRLGFTLLELIMVIVILGIIIGIAIPKWVDMREEAKQSTENFVVSSIQQALATYNASQHIH